MISNKRPKIGLRNITLALLILCCKIAGAQCTFTATVQGSGAGYTTIYRLTDPTGIVVDDTAPFETPSPYTGNFRLYAITYNNSNPPTGIALAVGSNISDVSGGCFDIDFIPAICRCVADATDVSVSTSGYNAATGYTQAYALMNGTTISETNTTGTFTAAQLSAAGLVAGSQVKIYAVNYNTTASPVPAVGATLPTTGCYDADSYALVSAYNCCPTIVTPANETLAVCSGGSIDYTAPSEAVVMSAGAVMGTDYSVSWFTDDTYTTQAPTVAPVNATCAPITITYYARVDCIADATVIGSGGVLEVTIYPAQPTVSVVDNTTCGQPTVQLLSQDGTLCGTPLPFGTAAAAVCGSGTTSVASNGTFIAADIATTLGGIASCYTDIAYNGTSSCPNYPIPTASATASPVSCYGGSDGSIDVTVTGGTSPYGYNWGTAPGSGNDPRTGLPAGTYTVTVTDDNSCSAETSATVTEPLAPLAITGVVASVSCFGGNNGSINLTVTGGTLPYTYNWGSAPGSGNDPRTGLPAGTYTVTVTDNNSCTATYTGTVTQPVAPLTVTATPTAAACFGTNSGSIDLTVTGGTSPYTYNWGTAPGGGIDPRNNLPSGTYTVTVTDNKGCTATASATVGQPAAALSATATVTNVSCYGGSNGSVDITAIGGTSPYTYNWGAAPGVGSDPRTGLPKGTYKVTVTDNNGCNFVLTAMVNQPSALTCPYTISPIGCAGGTGSIAINASGGTPSYTYAWSNGATTSSISGLAAGTYSFTVTDANNCTCSPNAAVVINNPPPIVLLQAPVNTNEGTTGGITPFYYNVDQFVIGGGTPPYSYTWSSTGYVRHAVTATTSSPPSATIRVTYADNAIWSVTITDANGCTSQQAIVTNMNQANDPLLDITSYNIMADNSALAGGQGSINLSVGGGSCTAAQLQYQWSGPNGFTAGTEDISGLLSGWYSVTVTCPINGQTTTGWYWVPATTTTSTGVRGKMDGSALLAVTPNPFSSVTAITFGTEQGGNTSVVVYGVDGRAIRTLFEGDMEATTTYTAEFDATNLPAGLYIVQLTTDKGEIQQTKLLLTK